MRSLILLCIFITCFGCGNENKTISVHSTDQPVPGTVHSAPNTLRANCDSLREELSKAKAGNFGKVTRIPNNFKESLLQLDTLTNPQIREWIKCLPDGDFTSYVHHGFGMYLRNNWGLWQGSRLAKNMYKMGVLHPDDMTGIILSSYQRKLKGENIRLEEQLKYYQDYWRKSGMPVDSILKANEKKSGG